MNSNRPLVSRTIYALAGCLLSFAQVQGAELVSSAIGWRVEGAGDPTAQRTTLLSLLDHPEKFTGKRVRVIGVLSVEFEDLKLYFGQEQYSNYLSDYAIRLELPEGAHDLSKPYQGKYVMVEGVLQAGRMKGAPNAIHVELLQMITTSR